MLRHRRLLVGTLLWSMFATTGRAQIDSLAEAQRFGAVRPAVNIQPDGLYICEAEEFQCSGPPGWQPKRFGENYYAATFANTFLSRKAFLGAPEQCEPSVAELKVRIEQGGRYLVLVRYEAAYRFETQFRVLIEQADRVVFDRLYGARTNLKIWPFGQKLKTEFSWSWGATENIVWEGHDALVELQPGPATVRLIAGRQPEPAARRNVDLVMLTRDIDQVQMRIEKEGYLPLDGMLTQSGDVYVRVTNLSDRPIVFRGRPAPTGGNWQQHSPYWVHLRTWKAPELMVAAGQTSDWVEVGSTMDSLADGQWLWTGDGRYRAEFAVRMPDESLQPLASFTGEGDLTLAADADTRYSRRLRKQEQVVYDLLAFLKQDIPAPHGHPPQQTTVYALTFEPLDSDQHRAAVAEFKKLFGLTDTLPDAPNGRGYIDVRGIPTEKLAEYCQRLGPLAQNVAVVSLGDEISLPQPQDKQVDEPFRRWLTSQGITVDSIAAGRDPRDPLWSTSDATRQSYPGLYYWSKRYQYYYGIQSIKERTDILLRHLPNAAVGANYSPHYPQEHLYLGEVFKWVTVFRQNAMTLPWSEDYIWQVPVGTPQMNNLNLDMFRAGNRKAPQRKIMYYVMPHAPNNTPNQWRRLFYAALGHGMTMVNLFEFRPVHVAYTENHVDDPHMYRMVLASLRELGTFEDIVQQGRIRGAQAGIWFSETADIWGDNHGSRAAAKRALYTAIRHGQLPVDVVIEQDALDGTLSNYKLLYLTDPHVSRAATARLAEWVHQGGCLFATAEAGRFDELNQPNEPLQKLLGIELLQTESPPESHVTWIKQDLPFAAPIDTVHPSEITQGVVEPGASHRSSPVFGTCTRFHTLEECQVLFRFRDGSPAAVSRTVGNGRVIYCGFLPGLSYYLPAIPRRPVDRGATDDSMAHFLPTQFDHNMRSLITLPADLVERPVVCSEPLVESCIIESPHGTAIVLVNWTGKFQKNLQVTVHLPNLPRQAILATGPSVTGEIKDESLVFRLDLDVADALILRPNSRLE